MVPPLTVFPDALTFAQDGKSVSIATVLSTWGSAPRPVGAQMALTDTGDMIGSISGGCVEAAVIDAHTRVMRTGVPEILSFGVSDDTAFSAGLSCGGEIEVLIDPVGTDHGMSLQDLTHLTRAIQNRQSVSYRINTTTWAHHILDAPLPTAWNTPQFTHQITAPMRIFIIGAVHIAQHLTRFAAEAGYLCHVMDPRSQFATDTRFPGCDITCAFADETLSPRDFDGQTAVITLAHDPKIDLPALEMALQSEAFYIAALGSNRTHAKRQDDLLARGFTPEKIARIHGPAGLDIGARDPAEIALSILAELTLKRRGLKRA
ncbi:MAG: XdhC family protein [Halocynthiibacter sp.]